MNSYVILVNKPRGLTSNKVVNIVKYYVGAKKAGHLGTLDKLGEGLLPVTINGATRLFEEFLNKDKEYIATFKFGEETPSFDLETEITNIDDKIVTSADVKNILKRFIGEFDQLPPKYSAKNINGKRAYHLIQSNQDFEVKPKRICIHDIKLEEDLGHNTFRFKIHCSSGTYIRSICRDMASELSTCGVMYDIKRTKCGIFNLKNANTLEEVENNKFNKVSIENIFVYPKIMLTNEQISKILQGVKITLQQPDGDYKIYNEDVFFGVGYIAEGKLRMRIKV